MGGKSSPPPPPDYTGAAQATAQGNLAVANQTTSANRVNQVTPYGNMTYSQGPATVDQAGYNAAMQAWQSIPGKNASPAPTIAQFTNPGQWTANTTLTPQQQQLFDSQQGLSQQYANIAQQGVNAVTPLLNNPSIDKNLPQMPQNAGKTTQDVIMSRLQPQIDRENAQLDAKLANQGITPGSEAYNTAHQLQSQQHNDLLNQAAGSGVSMDMNARNQAIQNNAAIMNQPLNIVNALRTGSQVTMPQFSNVPQQQQVAGPDILGATNAGYQAQVGNVNAQNATRAGMFGTAAGLGGAAMMATGMF